MAIDRLISILAVLLREGQATAPQLARRFEVSQRTIYRDIDRLCRAGIPLRTERGIHGGISIMEGYSLDQTVLTNADRGAILAGLHSLDSVSGTGYYRQLMEKLPQTETGAADDYVIIDLASWYGPLLAPRLEALKEACRLGRLVRFTYCAPGGDTRRVVEPARLVFRWSSWYLFGWCRERRDWRMFKLTRMLDLETLEETFPSRPVPCPVTPVERIYPDALQASVRFAPAARWRLIDEYGPESFTREPDGSLLFRRGFPDKEELLRWVLSFQDQAELLEPGELRRELADRLKKIYEKYDSQLSGFMGYHGYNLEREVHNMVESRCGILCSKCGFRESMGCKGCINIEKPFWGESCPVKSSCEEKGHAHCGQCGAFPCDVLKGFAYDPQQGDNGARIEQCRKWREEA